MTNGIYTLANDVVYEQLVALLNSIEANIGTCMPVCIIPYDNHLDKVRTEVENRNNVTLFDDTKAITYWENFVTKAWLHHHKAQKVWKQKGLSPVYRLAMHRKLCCFHGPFEKFVYFDADTLAMGSLDRVYQKLDNYDWVADDFQYKSDIKYIFDAPQDRLVQVFGEEKLRSHISCAGWFACKKGVFQDSQLNYLLDRLASGEAETMALSGPDQSLFNYMVMQSDISFYNFAYHDRTTGNHCSSKFEIIDNILYDRGQRLSYIHYMSVPTAKFNMLCLGKDIDIPYRDVFLHYRYLKSPSERPQKLTRPNWFMRSQRFSKEFFHQKIHNLKYRLTKLVAKSEP